MPGYQLSREGRYLHWSEELCQYARPSFICRLWSLSTICAYPSFPVSLLFDLPCSASLTGNVLFCHQDCPSPCCEKTLPSKTSWRRAILFGLNRDGRLRPYPQLHLHRHRCRLYQLPAVKDNPAILTWFQLCAEIRLSRLPRLLHLHVHLIMDLQNGDATQLLLLNFQEKLEMVVFLLRSYAGLRCVWNIPVCLGYN